MKVTKRSISIYIIILHLLTISSYCQNKKEQIFILERTNDSLQTEINREKTKYNVLSYTYNSISDSIYKDSLNIENKINSLKFQKNSMDTEIKKSKSSISTFKKISLNENL